MDNLEQVRAYHRATKHRLNRFARGPGYLEWATQPDPFRRYRGAPLLPLERLAPGGHPPQGPPLTVAHIEPAALDLRGVSQLFFDSLALSAWKRAGDTTWALRVNPSSGNLHPTEGYLLCGPVPGLAGTPMVAHYAPREHALEIRAEVPGAGWDELSAGLPAGAILVGLSSIHWREAWKYGERAFRYCQLDVGHAIAAISMAAAGLGWQATLLDDLGSEQVTRLLGIADPQGAEAEHPDCLLAVCLQGGSFARLALPEAAVTAFADLRWQGRPNRISPRHASWPIIEEVASATEKPPTDDAYGRGPSSPGREVAGEPEWTAAGVEEPIPLTASPLSLRPIIHQRRSAVAMDPRGSLDCEAFYRILLGTVAGAGRSPLNALPWRRLVHLVLFVHRIEGLAPGLYLLVRDPERKDVLRSAMRPDFVWERPPSCPPGLDLYRLAAGDARAVARQLSCHQEIASHGCFSLGMLAELEGPLQRFGAWFYRRLFWECGTIGQMLYLGAEVAGVRGTGIGCFFDDPVHELLGLETERFQSLYHFTVGHPVEDARLTTLPAYPCD